MAIAQSTTAAANSENNLQTSAQRVDAAALMRIKNLELRAKVVVEGMFGGLHRSPYHGFSVEFSEYRQYAQGDDPRYIDWKLYARTDRHFIKRFEDETNLRCNLLVDRSRSMSFGTQGAGKSDYAITLAATIAYFLTTQRDAVGVLTFADRVIGYLPARYRQGHFHRLLSELGREESGTSTDVEAPLQQVAQLTRKRGMIVLISDLLVPIGEIGKRLGLLRTQGHDVLVMRVLDPAERTLQIEKPMMLRDAETGKKLYINPEQARAQYQANFNQHAQEIVRVCNQLGIDFINMSTDEPLEQQLFHFLNARQRLASQSVQRATTWQGRR